MRFEGGSIVRDQNGSSPGQYGDSCFDTFAFGLSHWFVYKQYPAEIDHTIFITPTGAVRHPKSIWRQNDMTEDNEKPLYIFLRETQNNEARQFIADRCWDDLKTGNMKLVTPGYVAELLNWQWLRCLCLVVQVLAFWFPWYWNDGDWKNGRWPIRLSWNKSDGYLQWALIANLAPWPVRRLIRKKTLKRKVIEYYMPEIKAGMNTKATFDIISAHDQMVDLL